MTDAIQATGQGTGAARAAAAAGGGPQRIRPDVESFLTLLTAQISNQDPLAPMDSSTFVTQLAQLSQVEQSMEMTQQLQSISAQLASAATVANLGLVGRTVEVPGGTLRPGGAGAFSYELEAAADRVTALVTGADGAVIRRLEGLPGAPGTRHELLWDGNDDAGLPVLGEGPFAVAVAAQDPDGAPVGAATWVEAVVEGVIGAEGGGRLALDNGTSVEAAAIARIR